MKNFSSLLPNLHSVNMVGTVLFWCFVATALASNPAAEGSTCDFDNGLCSWKQSTADDADWNLNFGSTPSSNTGPFTDHGGNGKYIYIEASNMDTNARAVLSFKGPNSKTVCFALYYHMYGSTINTLQIYNRGSIIMERKGDQGDTWKKAKMTISGNFDLRIEASAGSSYTGDIAVDDISVSDGPCAGVPPTPTLPPTPPIPSLGPPGFCGSRPNTRIVGGTEALANSWPWQAMLMKRKYSSSHSQFCGGSLVDPFWVVTAAHCVKGKSPSSIFIRMGAHYRKNGTVGTEQDIDVAQIISHESYHSPLRYSHDIALLQLAKPVKLGKGVGLVCLPHSSLPLPLDNLNKKCWITGWGTLASGGKQPNALMQASVPLVSKQRCLKGYPGQIHDSMLCAGLDQGGVDACQGDSGGPLVCEVNGRWYLEGATSWGHGCAAPNKYGIYAKVRYLISWINNKMSSTAPPPTFPPTMAPANPDPSCDFDTSLCFWRQSTTDDFDWRHWGTVTPSADTGPTTDVDGNGSYIYIETSRRDLNDTAILTFTGFNNKTVCLSFYYHMYGDSINTLNIYNRRKKIWSRAYDQGDMWKKGQVTISGNYDLEIEGIAGFSYTGDIAVDKISVSDGPCSVPPSPSVSVTTPTPSQGPTGNVSCGISPMTRVIGGVDATPGSWPWQVALLKGSSKSFSCGGSLIAPDWVVTAAHCTSRGKPASYYTIRLGDHDRDTNEGTEEDIPGKRVIVHPYYNTPVHNNDIALIQLARPATLSSRVGTVCLPFHEEVVPTSSRCFITGWGKIKYPGSSHPTLQQAKLPSVTNDVCAKKLLASSGSIFQKITPQMICAGTEGTILSSCQGDSGGPYVCQKSDGNWVLQGVVSWGSSTCSAAEYYSVFARVAKFRNWIDQNMQS